MSQKYNVKCRRIAIFHEPALNRPILRCRAVLVVALFQQSSLSPSFSSHSLSPSSNSPRCRHLPAVVLVVALFQQSSLSPSSSSPRCRPRPAVLVSVALVQQSSLSPSSSSPRCCPCPEQSSSSVYFPLVSALFFAGVFAPMLGTIFPLTLVSLLPLFLPNAYARSRSSDSPRPGRHPRPGRYPRPQCSLVVALVSWSSSKLVPSS